MGYRRFRRGSAGLPSVLRFLSHYQVFLYIPEYNYMYNNFTMLTWYLTVYQAYIFLHVRHAAKVDLSLLRILLSFILKYFFVPPLGGRRLVVYP